MSLESSSSSDTIFRGLNRVQTNQSTNQHVQTKVPLSGILECLLPMMPSTKKTILVALIEDDPNDVFLFQRALTRGGFAWPLINFKDGREAVDYFKPLESTITPSPRLPDIILTDIKMPRLDGIAFLHWLRGEPELNDLPVIVLTSSVLPSDMDQAHRLGIFDFITKEATYENVVPALERFLGSLNKDSGSSKPVGAVMNSRPQLL